MRITIHLYRRDLEDASSEQHDVGVLPIHLPVRDMDAAQKFAMTALASRIGPGSRCPNAGHVTDDMGRIIITMLQIGLNKVVVRREDG